MKWSEYFSTQRLFPRGLESFRDKEKEILDAHKQYINKQLERPMDANNGLEQGMGELDLNSLCKIMEHLKTITLEKLKGWADISISILISRNIVSLCHYYEERAKELTPRGLAGEEKQTVVIPVFSFLAIYHYSLAREDRNPWEYAAGEYTKALSYDPGNLSYLARRRALYLDNDKKELAKADYKTIVELKRDDGPGNYEIGAYMASWEDPNAIGRFNQAITLQAKVGLVPYAWYGARAYAYHKQGKLDSALDDFQEAITQARAQQGDSVWLPYFSRRIDILETQKKYAAAIAECDQLLRIPDDESLKWHKRKAELCVRQGRFNAAAESYLAGTGSRMKLLGGIPDLTPLDNTSRENGSPCMKTLLASWLDQLSQLSLYTNHLSGKHPIERLLDAAIEADRTLSIARICRGVFVTTDAEQVISDFIAVRYDRDAPMNLRLFADIKLQQLSSEYKQDPSFRSTAVEQLEHEESVLENILLLGVVATKEGDAEKMEACLKKIEALGTLELEKVPRYMASEAREFVNETCRNRINQAIESLQYQTALNHIRNSRAVSTIPQDAFIRKEAYIYLRMRYYETAIPYYDLLTDSGHVKDYQNRGMAEAYLGKYKEAQKSIKRAIELTKAKPVVPQLSTALGVIYMLQGEHKKAQETFSKAIPADPVARVYRGTPDDFVTVLNTPEISGQMKFYATLKLREEKHGAAKEEEQEAAFEQFKTVLQEKIDAQINVAESQCLLILAEVQKGELDKAQARYESLIKTAELQHIPFYLRRDFLELPLTLNAHHSFNASNAKESVAQFESMVQTFNQKAKPLTQAALWRTLNTASKLESEAKVDKFSNLVEKLSDQLADIPKKTPIDLAASVIEDNVDLKKYLKDHHHRLFKRYEKRKEGNTVVDQPVKVMNSIN